MFKFSLPVTFALIVVVDFGSTVFVKDIFDGEKSGFNSFVRSIFLILMFSNVGIVAIGNEEIVEFCLPIGVTEEILPEIKLVILSYDYKYKCLYLNDWKVVVNLEPSDLRQNCTLVVSHLVPEAMRLNA